LKAQAGTEKPNQDTITTESAENAEKKVPCVSLNFRIGSKIRKDSKKGSGALNFRPRGSKLKDLIYLIEEGTYITEKQPVELNEHAISEIETT
jgi:hypothetical protein